MMGWCGCGGLEEGAPLNVVFVRYVTVTRLVSDLVSAPVPDSSTDNDGWIVEFDTNFT